MTRFLAALAALALLAGCAKFEPPTRAAVVDGHIRILERIPGLHRDAAADQWWTRRRAGEGQLAVVELQGTVAVRADVPGGSLMGRRVDAALAATPYLRWSWYLEPAMFGGGPGSGESRGLRVVVFFRSNDRPWTEEWSSWLWAAPAEWDRWAEISFGGVGAAQAQESEQRKFARDDSLRRIDLRAPRTGQAGEWHVEAIDLIELHRRYWPDEDPAKVRISLIAFGGYSGPVPGGLPVSIGYVSDVVLSR
ncbi:MAG: DUF3047 domain-containing protein [Tagaea sp.]|nr:DUF3047 domain-containing protein [Tagaea sp.]